MSTPSKDPETAAEALTAEAVSKLQTTIKIVTSKGPYDTIKLYAAVQPIPSLLKALMQEYKREERTENEAFQDVMAGLSEKERAAMYASTEMKALITLLWDVGTELVRAEKASEEAPKGTRLKKGVVEPEKGEAPKDAMGEFLDFLRSLDDGAEALFAPLDPATKGELSGIFETKTWRATPEVTRAAFQKLFRLKKRPGTLAEFKTVGKAAMVNAHPDKLEGAAGRGANVTPAMRKAAAYMFPLMLRFVLRMDEETLGKLVNGSVRPPEPTPAAEPTEHVADPAPAADVVVEPFDEPVASSRGKWGKRALIGAGLAAAFTVGGVALRACDASASTEETPVPGSVLKETPRHVLDGQTLAKKHACAEVVMHWVPNEETPTWTTTTRPDCNVNLVVSEDGAVSGAKRPMSLEMSDEYQEQADSTGKPVLVRYLIPDSEK